MFKHVPYYDNINNNFNNFNITYNYCGIVPTLEELGIPNKYVFIFSVTC